jgi:outer membrane protein OmpA-like peptidoglycan-associated protein
MKRVIHPIIGLLALCGILFHQQSLAQEQPTEKKKGIDIIITQSPKIHVKLEAATNNLCHGESKGAINVSASGGYPPYKYYWSSGDTTQDVAGLKAGMYKVAVYDGFSCSDTLEIKITEPPQLLGKVESVQDILCYGYNNGEVNISVGGGKSPYTYSWSNGSKAQNLKGVNSGRYSVLITDANACQEIVTADVLEKPLIVRSIDDVQNIKCFGDNTGSVDITVSGGVPPYSYAWNTGLTTEDLRQLKAGVYEVVVKDSKGCTEVSSTKVIEPAAIAVSFDRLDNLRCFGDQGGAINIDVKGGKPPYNYTWNNGARTQDIAGISAGDYTVKIADANGCSSQVSTKISQPDELTVSLVELKNVLNNGGTNGSVTIATRGGIAPYKYKWAHGSVLQNLTGLAAGSYSVRVTDANGCAKIMSVSITEPLPLVLKLDNATNINCHGNKTGAVSVSVQGGVTPYAFKWSNGATTEDIRDLGAGKYSVVVTDANGHNQSLEVNLTEPPAFQAQVVSTKDIACSGQLTGAIDITASGGVAPYRYRWSNGQISQDVDRLPAGNYTVKVLDANSCELDLSATISQPEPLKLEFARVTDVKCMGDSTGAIDINVAGGVLPYKYKWSNQSAGQDLKSLRAGTYSVAVTDAKGCSGTLEARINEPRKLTLVESGVKNVDCNGNATGSVNLSAAGGVTPYRYRWSSGDSVLNIANKKAGTYSLRMTDANGCVAQFSKTITEPTKVTKSVTSVTNNLCFADSKGAIDIAVAGGMAPYSYRWSNGAITQDISGVRAGNYSVLIRDANGCVDSLRAQVTENPQLVASLKAINIACNGQKTGSVDLTVSGGVAPYTYKWNNAATTQDISLLPSGNYSVILKDTRGCTTQSDVQVTEPPRFVASLESDKDLNCFGEKTGAVNVRISGGVTPYRYRWNTGDTTRNIASVAVGTYTLTASDANGCTQSVTTTLTQPPKINFSIKSVKDVSCNGDAEGAIDVVVSGGVGPFAYKWNNGATTQDVIGVKAGAYNVQITDANGCINTLEATIKEPPTLTLKVDSVVNILCHGERKGAVNITVAGGVAPYTYTWSNGATTQDISLLPAGNYSVTVFDTKGCSQSANVTVTEPPALEAKLVSVKDIACFGDKAGAVTIDVIGGVKPYTFKWSNGASSQNLTNVAAGTYTVDISDKNGCIQKLTATVSQPPKLVVASGSIKNISCAGGTDGAINVTVTGGVAPFTYKWSNGATTQDLAQVGAGVYSLLVIDGNGCRDSTIRAELKQPVLLDVKVAKVTDVLQYGRSTGAIDISVAGGVAPYAYSWSNGATTQDVTAIPGGNYSVLVMDANGCEKTVTAVINQPPAMDVRLAGVTDIKCAGDRTGAINLTVTGGLPPYSFKWNNGDSTRNITNVPAGDYSVTVTDASGHHQTLNAKIAQPTPLQLKLDAVTNLLCYDDKKGAIAVTVTGGSMPYQYKWNSGQTAQDISGIGAGDYTLNVIDGAGCKAVLEAKVLQPDAFTVVVGEIKNVNCKGDNKGEIRLDVNGGVSPYTYNWSTGARTKDITSGMAGKYSVKVTDANGCIRTGEASVTEPAELVASVASVTNNACFGESKGAVTLSVAGGSQPYTFAWSNGSASQNLAEVPRGQYSVIVTDANGCTRSLSANITEPTQMITTLKSVADVNCFGEKTGNAEVVVSGGTTPYTFAWNNGLTTQNLTNVASGDYQLTVKDVKGCTNTLSAKISQPEALKVVLDTIQHIACYGESKGMADVIVSGGSLPYQYVWSNGATTEDLINVMAGNYTLRIKDARGCIQNLNAVINQPQQLMLSLDSLQNITCSGQQTGKITVRATGGVEPYAYSWSNGATARRITNVPAGRYTSQVKDKNGCEASLVHQIEQPRPLIRTIDAITDVRCQGDSTGSIYVTVRDGVAPYTFRWNNGATTEDLRSITAGNYKLTITESNGCQSMLDATIEEPPAFAATVVSKTDVKCFGNTTGAININVTGGVEPYAYTWSNRANTKDLLDVGADSYTVMIADANGCLRTLHSQITEPPLLNLTIDSVRNVKCCGDNSGAIFISVEGGVKPYKYEWSNGATTEDIQNLILGVYTVNVTDANGCVVSTPDDMTLYEQVVSKGMFTTRDILFDVGKSTIKPESFTTINRIASFMKEHPDISFRIDGHTDSDGSAEFNQKLSEDRAKAIRAALIKFGIRDNRLDAKGWGESKPISTNLTTEGKSLNRRVEFIALTGTLEGTLIEPDAKSLPK